MNLPPKCLVDTNVPIVANYAMKPDPNADFPPCCILACVEAIEHVIDTQGLILDAGNEIYGEYSHKLNSWGPSIGDRFFKWVHDYRWMLDESQRVPINPKDDTFVEFPSHRDLEDFDISDRKFVAVANTHEEKPPILQATDSKWWGWKEALADVDIEVCFLCAEYVEAKYASKMGK
ncbi:MAG: hypothetical protein OXB95_02810 [Rhodobacteraceae bacterium]|nr:hypothetical protein [Paracoccaceae bacterium]